MMAPDVARGQEQRRGHLRSPGPEEACDMMSDGLHQGCFVADIVGHARRQPNSNAAIRALRRAVVWPHLLASPRLRSPPAQAAFRAARMAFWLRMSVCRAPPCGDLAPTDVARLTEAAHEVTGGHAEKDRSPRDTAPHQRGP